MTTALTGSVAQSGSNSLEGIIIAKIFHQRILDIKSNIIKESLVNSLKSLHGIAISLATNIYVDENEYQAILSFRMAQVDTAKIVILTGLILQKKDDREMNFSTRNVSNV